MNALDLDVLDKAMAWQRAGHATHLFTVVSTWGASPRQPGAMLALRSDGQHVGSISGGCLEDELAERARQGRLPLHPELITYGVSRDEAERLRIPCGGKLAVLCEPLADADSLRAARDAVHDGRLVTRELDLASGRALCRAFDGERRPSLTQHHFRMAFGPRWRLLIIGANQVAQVLAEFAAPLDFQVLLCEPRTALRAEWPLPDSRFVDAMPDDAVQAIGTDRHTAIVAVTHDPKLDDMALLQALKSEAFYVGALGSALNQRKRRERLALMEMSSEEIARLHGPIGLPIHSRTPAEIAVSILAELVKARAELGMASAKPALDAAQQASDPVFAAV